MDIYDIGASDLKELWDSDLDPAMQDTLKLTTDSDMHDWFLERGDGKLPGVILNDKLMTDAILATFPIKTEHSYSLTSDGDSMPDSPNSLQNKMDDIDDDCYPVITMVNNNNTNIHNNSRLLSLINNNNNNDNNTNNNNNINNNNNTNNNNNNNNNSNIVNHNLNHHNLIHSLQSPATPATTNPTNVTNILNSNNLNSLNNHLTSNSNNNNNNSLIINHNLNNSNSCVSNHNNIINNNNNNHNQLILNQLNTDSSSTTSSLSDIDIDDTNVKDEPISPDSSCPPSPNSSENFNLSTMNLANMANYTQTDLVFEHKNGTMQLSQASQNLLKNQQQHMLLGSPTSHQHQQLQSQSRLMLPKFNVKMESQSSSFGLPPTPPSSLPSDESEGNQSPEHHLSPMSPPAPVAANHRRTSVNTNSHTPMNGIHSSPSYNSPSMNSPRNFSSSSGSTRQPIHTPLISSQPKGSTGSLMLTEEEKRTLLAEGYPIPTRLPLTKAEEKSLKKIRRKIKNKISAQESRRKKKEYMDQLERKVEILVTENSDYRKRVDNLEDSNASLMSQLKQLQAMISRQNGKKTN